MAIRFRRMRWTALCAFILAAGRLGAQCVPDTLLQAISNPAPAAGDNFGISVAIDGNLAAVGAHQDDPGGVTDAGHAYIFNAATGALQATLSNPAPTASDWFGFSVAISGTAAVVGAHYDYPGGVFQAGTAYVFDTTSGTLQATLNNPAPEDGDAFGNSVAISGSLALVGAWLDDPGGWSNAGSAYVFDITTGNLQATLSNPTPTTSYDFFGCSVAISGNVALVGAYSDNPGGVNGAGTAYVFDASNGSLQATLNSPVLAASGQFGKAVAIDGNLAVVGAPRDSPGGVSEAGAAYVFDAASGALQAILSNPAPDMFDRFGSTVAISGNLVVVGAAEDDLGSVNGVGTVYFFDALTGALSATLSNPAPAFYDNFGNSVAIFGDLAVVGAIYDDPGGVSAAGTAYIFGCPPNATRDWNLYH